MCVEVLSVGLRWPTFMSKEITEDKTWTWLRPGDQTTVFTVEEPTSPRLKKVRQVKNFITTESKAYSQFSSTFAGLCTMNSFPKAKLSELFYCNILRMSEGEHLAKKAWTVEWRHWLVHCNPTQQCGCSQNIQNVSFYRATWSSFLTHPTCWTWLLATSSSFIICRSSWRITYWNHRWDSV